MGHGQWSLKTFILRGREGDWGIHTAARPAKGAWCGQQVSVRSHRPSGLQGALQLVPWTAMLQQGLE